MPKKEQEIPIPFSLDDFYTTQEQRDEDNKEKVEIVDIDKIDSFKNHPFRVEEDSELKQIMDSIKNNGFFDPVLIRPTENGRYEMVSGHRRMKACQMLGLKTIPSHIRNLSDDEATIIMVDSNLKREVILPSEKAYAYKMKMDALNHQGKTLSPMGTKSESVSEINDSKTQVFRYIRLTYLIPELLKFVDNNVLKESPAMALRPAVEISYLTKDEQSMLLDTIEFSPNKSTPSLEQAIKLRELSKEKKLDVDVIDEMLAEQKPNQISKFKIDEDRLYSVLPKNIQRDKVEDYILKACTYYAKHMKDKELGR